MNHHEEEGIVDGIRTEEGEGDGKRKLDDDVEGEMRKRKAWKFLISSWVVIDMGRPPPPHENRKQFKLPSPLGPANFRPRLSNQRISTLSSPPLSISLYIYTCCFTKGNYSRAMSIFISNWKRIGSHWQSSVWNYMLKDR